MADLPQGFFEDAYDVGGWQSVTVPHTEAVGFREISIADR